MQCHILDEGAEIFDWSRDMSLQLPLNSIEDEAARRAFIAEYKSSWKAKYFPGKDGRIPFSNTTLLAFAVKGSDGPMEQDTRSSKEG